MELCGGSEGSRVSQKKKLKRDDCSMKVSVNVMGNFGVKKVLHS